MADDKREVLKLTMKLRMNPHEHEFNIRVHLFLDFVILVSKHEAYATVTVLSK